MESKYFHVALLAGLILATPLISLGHAGEGIVAPGDVIEEIRIAQHAPSASEIDCQLVTEAQFGELGHAWMEVIHPDDEHRFMEEMIAGQSPEAYRIMHIRLGARYLGCDYRRWDIEAAGRNGTSEASDTSRMLIWLIAGAAVVAVLARAVRKG